MLDKLGEKGAASCALFRGGAGPETTTYDHRCRKTRDPVRSPIDNLATAESVLRSVTTGESSVLYVFVDVSIFVWGGGVELSSPWTARQRSWTNTTRALYDAGDLRRPDVIPLRLLGSLQALGEFLVLYFWE